MGKSDEDICRLDVYKRQILSDNDGHYLELMVGGYSDNQPDYSWINPGEIREFSQIWYPIKGIKGVKNATKEMCIRDSDHTAQLCRKMKAK